MKQDGAFLHLLQKNCLDGGEGGKSIHWHGVYRLYIDEWDDAVDRMDLLKSFFQNKINLCCERYQLTKLLVTLTVPLTAFDNLAYTFQGNRVLHDINRTMQDID